MLKDVNYVSQIRKFYNQKMNLIPKLSPENIAIYDRYLGYPSRLENFIHVTGTNGKGTFCTSLKEILLKVSKNNLKIGVFMSPHVSTFRERIQINNEMIDKQYVTDFLEKAWKDMEKLDVEISFFDQMTQMSFSYFRDNNVDQSIIEVGMGGFTDSTNIIQDPILSVLTTIGYDHENFLGNTIEKIAYQKSGIIKKNSKVLIGSSVPKDIVLNRMNELNNPVSNQHEIPSFTSDYNEYNFQLHKKSLQILSETWEPLQRYKTDPALNDEREIRQNFLERQKPKCRFEKIDKDNIKLKNFACKNVYQDVGHNEQGIRETLKLRELDNFGKKIHIIYGAKDKKKQMKIFDAFENFSSKIEMIHFIYSEGSGSMESVDFEKQAKELNLKIPYKIIENGDIQTTLDYLLLNKLDKDDLLLALGSFSIMKDMRKYFSIEEEVDPYNQNEMAFDVRDKSNLLI